MVKVEVDSQFYGPTVTELLPVLDGISDNPVKVRWGGTKEEARLLETIEEKDFTVCVTNLAEMGSVAGMLGCPVEKAVERLANTAWTAARSEVACGVAVIVVLRLLSILLFTEVT